MLDLYGPDGSGDGHVPWEEPNGLFVSILPARWKVTGNGTGPGWTLTGGEPEEQASLMVYPKTPFTSLDYFLEVLGVHAKRVGFSLQCEELMVGSAVAFLIQVGTQQGTSFTLYVESGDLVFELNSPTGLDGDELIEIAECIYPTYRVGDDPTGGRAEMLGTWNTNYGKNPLTSVEGGIGPSDEWIFDYLGNLYIRSPAGPGGLPPDGGPGVLEQAYLQYWVIRNWLYIFGGDIWMVLPVEQAGDTLTVGKIVLWRGGGTVN